MAEDKIQVSTNGQAVNRDDINTAFSEAALADDRTLAELLRIAPWDGVAANVTRAIIPYRIQPNATVSASGGTVIPSGSANGKVKINPFRAVIGSRTLVATDAKANWRDIRSSVVTGTTTLSQTNGDTGFPDSFGANASGNPRWDLVYAQVLVDANAAGVVRKVKDPTSGVVTSPTVTVTTTQTVSVKVAAGTTGATPAFPALPADPGGGYNVPIAYVRIPNGFGAGSTILTSQIRESATVVLMSAATGVSTMAPTEMNDSRILSTQLDTWGSAGTRPETFVPRTMTGKHERFFLLDLQTPITATGDILDASIDWRNRYFKVCARAGAAVSGVFASSIPGTPANAFPIPSSTASFTTMGQSFVADATYVAASRTVAYFEPTGVPNMAAATAVTLYVDASGNLKIFLTGAPACRIMVWLESTAQFPNA